MAAQAGLCLAWSETPEDTFCRLVAQISSFSIIIINFLIERKPKFGTPTSLFEPRHDKTCLREFPTRPDTNLPAQPLKLDSLEISAIESWDIILSKQRTTKALIRLRGCAGWSVSLLFEYDMTHYFMAQLIYLPIPLTPHRVSITRGAVLRWRKTRVVLGHVTRKYSVKPPQPVRWQTLTHAGGYLSLVQLKTARKRYVASRQTVIPTELSRHPTSFPCLFNEF